jgi:hypothetical protein
MNMRIGAFEIQEPIPDLRGPHAFATLRPWVDAGNVGSLTTTVLESGLGALRLGEVFRPGHFFDFTRYRPISRFVDGRRVITMPNSHLSWARSTGDNDFLFLHLLEPHIMGETYVDSILRVLRRFDVKRYCLLGSMYDAVPHTRPLILTGSTPGSPKGSPGRLNVRRSNYEGPTTIVSLLAQEAPKYGIETMSLIVHLPQYIESEQDSTGALRLLEVLGSLYDFPLDLETLKKGAAEQQVTINSAVQQDTDLQQLVRQLEAYYDARAHAEEETPRLSAEVEQFLREMDKRFGRH